MTSDLALPPELEDRLRREAERLGLPPDSETLKLLLQRMPPEERRAAALVMLRRWAAEDEAMTEEEAASNVAVLRAVDEDRLSDRKLFADILKDEPE